MNEIKFNASEAASIYEACHIAIKDRKAEMMLERSKHYRRALQMEVDDYGKIAAKCVEFFPVLTEAVE